MSSAHTPRRVLVVDDDADLCRFLAAGLAPLGFEVTWKTAAAEALEVLDAGNVDVVVSDVDMPGMDGIELCERVVANRPDVPVTMLTTHGNLETAVAALRAGAYDFITKPPDLKALALALERAVQHRHLRDEVKRLRHDLQNGTGPGNLIGTSPSMRKLAEIVERVIDSEASVLITGESGTGKELVARALHARGRRRRGPFVAINCAAMPEALLESELFGHVRGAFTDARVDRTGLFVQASGGTLLLDEIGELPLVLQPKLLRALQERTVRPVGGNAEIPCDVRLVAVSNQDLEAAVRDRRFREDLYFRINVIHVALPPLRERGTDVLLLAQHFVDRYAAQAGKGVTGLAPATAQRLLAYGWPGNVRELQNCIERAVALARYDRMTVDDLPEKIRRYRGSRRVNAATGPTDLVPLEDVEKRYILQVLESVRGNRTVAARTLGLDRKTLRRKLERYGVGD